MHVLRIPGRRRPAVEGNAEGQVVVRRGLLGRGGVRADPAADVAVGEGGLDIGRGDAAHEKTPGGVLRVDVAAVAAADDRIGAVDAADAADVAGTFGDGDRAGVLAVLDVLVVGRSG